MFSQMPNYYITIILPNQLRYWVTLFDKYTRNLAKMKESLVWLHGTSVPEPRQCYVLFSCSASTTRHECNFFLIRLLFFLLGWWRWATEKTCLLVFVMTTKILKDFFLRMIGPCLKVKSSVTNFLVFFFLHAKFCSHPGAKNEDKNIFLKSKNTKYCKYFRKYIATFKVQFK